MRLDSDGETGRDSKRDAPRPGKRSAFRKDCKARQHRERKQQSGMLALRERADRKDHDHEGCGAKGPRLQR